MMNKLGNTILKDLGEYVKEINFQKEEPLTIEYLPIEETVDFIKGQNFLYNFLKEEFLNKFHKNYKLLYIGVYFTTDTITVMKSDDMENYKIDNERLYEQLKEILE